MDYIERVKKFHKLSNQIEKIKSHIRQEFVSYCREKYPDKISKLERKIKKKIIEIECIRYIYKYGWCNSLFINTNGGYMRLVVDCDNGWDESQTVTHLTYVTNKNIIIILRGLFDEFPYITEIYI